MSIWSRIGKFLGVKSASKSAPNEPVEVPRLHADRPSRSQPARQAPSRARQAPSSVLSGGTEFRVVLAEYGPVMRIITNPREQSIAGAYYNALGHFLKGDVPDSGPGKDDPYWYQHKVESFEGETINGDPLETDIYVLMGQANARDFSDTPYESWQ